MSYQNTTGETAHIEAWIDWDNNGSFDDLGEKVLDVSDSGSGLHNRIETIVPINAVLNELIGLRIRIGHQDNMTPYGFQSIGEVEDYLIETQCLQKICTPISITRAMRK